MKIKICGIRTLSDISLVNQYQPDLIGFIFYPKSKRYINFEQAQRLKENLNSNIKTVGVFVNSNADDILHGFKSQIFDYAQLHGDESQEEISYLQYNNCPVIKAIRIKDKSDLNKVFFYKPNYYLFDVNSTKFIGGTGESFDWKLLNYYNSDIPYFLAGGINSSNIQNALKTKAYALDISSGVETDFHKDKDKVKELFTYI